MESKDSQSSEAFPMGETPQEKGGFDHVPDCYKVAPAIRPSFETTSSADDIPVIDMDGMNDHARRFAMVQDISKASKKCGFFQIVNHGISEAVMDGALSTTSRFFKLPAEEKNKFMSNDVHDPVRYGTSIKDGLDKLQSWRIILKHYANPLHKYISLWPQIPHDYREKMGAYAKAAHKLGLWLMGALTEGLGLGPDYVAQKMEDGLQTMVVNCFPPCPEPDLVLGLPPHSDYSCLTVVLQSSAGLEIQDYRDGKWRDVPHIRGALQVNIGDCLEVLSNGLYKSVVHKVKVSYDSTRISIASLHTLGLNEKMETAQELVDERRPKGYKESSFKDFLDFITKNDISLGKMFIHTLRLQV